MIISGGSVSPPRACSAPGLAAKRSMTKGRLRLKRGLGEASVRWGAGADDNKIKGSRGGLRYNRRQGGRLLDPRCELEVLKCIILREGYLSRVTRLAENISRRAKRSRGQTQTLPASMIDLLDLLRTATLDTVEAISLWRLSQADPTPTPFEWNGHNYLLKMLHDCDFLDRVEALRTWLGFRVSRNPFFLPHGSTSTSSTSTSSNLSDCADNPEEGGDGGSTTAALQFDKTGPVDVGRQPWLGPLKITATAEEVPAIRAGGRNLKRLKASGRVKNLAPYAAAVLNDPSLLPKTSAASPTRGDSATATLSATTNKRTTVRLASIASVDIEGIVPNLVSKEDVQRAIAARKALDEEERRASDAVGVVEGEESRPHTTASDRSRNNRGKQLGPSTSSSPAANETGHRVKHCPQYNLRDHRNTRRDKSASASTVDATIEVPSRTATHNATAIRMRSLALTAAGLMQRPHPNPHPGLGPVLPRSVLPGGELPRRPFDHTVTDFTDVGKHDGIEPAFKDEATGLTTRENRGCSTAPSASPAWKDASTGGERCPLRHSPLPVSTTDRATTAPVRISSDAVLLRRRGTPVDATEENAAEALFRQSFVAPRHEERLGMTTDTLKDASRASSRKAGAELRALTAAGTTGRRKPPPREARLRRLERDVGRQSAELRELRRAEEVLRRTLVRCLHGQHGGKYWWLSETGHHAEEDEGDPVAKVAAIRGNVGWASPVEAETESVTSRSGLGERCASESVNVVDTKQEQESDHSRNHRSPHKTDILEPRKSGAPPENGIFEPEDEGTEDVNLSRPSIASTDRMKHLLEAKRREIELKTVDLAVKRDELGCLRAVQRQERERKGALEMERRRARLPEGKILPEDEAVACTLEDHSALAIQKRHRGIRGRQYAAWYKGTIHQAATMIQRGVRCVWDRRATARRLLLHASARPIQATVRMFLVRQRYLHLLAERRELLACRKLQRACRGMLGRRRAGARRSMIAAAGKALQWVSLENLQPKHLKELENAIRGALVDPLRQFPPPGVLGALRVVLTILGDAGTGMDEETSPTTAYGGLGDMVTFQTALGQTVRGPVSPPHLTWEMAARVLGRPFRLLRRLRAFASGLGAASDPTPARILSLPPRALELLEAYRNDASWAREALLALTEGGGIAAASLAGWARELLVVHREQPHVENFLTHAQPAWLRKSRALQRRRRTLELKAESCHNSVAVAGDHRHNLETQGLAYGDPLLALGTLEGRLGDAQAALKELEAKRIAFLAAQAKAQAVDGQALREAAEFADREACIAARAESMARRIGQGGPEGLAELGRKRLDCEVVLRELRRCVRVWERRCREEYTPLLEEWVPPTERQMKMARSLGRGTAWEEILTVQKARLVERAGGTRFVKGLKGEDFHNWRGVCEGLRASREDIESVEARLDEDVRQFEQGVRTADVTTAAHKMSSTPWDNATDETLALERAEDIKAAQEERRTTMGALLPPGLLEGTPGSPPRHGQGFSGLSTRPTLVLLGLDLPASLRSGIRARLDREAPGVFGLHLTGEDALPSGAKAAKASGRGFFAPSRELTENESLDSSQGATAAVERAQTPLISQTRGTIGVDARSPRHKRGEPSRAAKVQAALSAGHSVSLEVIPGPGVWARGRFLRDLESLLEGIDGCDDCNGCKDDEVGRKAKRGGPTVLLLEGHQRNRSGGGAEVRHGTRFATALGPAQIDSSVGRAPPRTFGRGTGGPSAAVAMATKRRKCLLEEAAQCLHDLRTTHGATPSQFLAITAESRATAGAMPVQEAHHVHERGEGNDRNGRGAFRSIRHVSTGGALKATVDVGYASRLDVLLAACLMLLYPHRQYDVGQSEAGNDRENRSKVPQSVHEETARPGITGADETDLSNASDLAKACRNHFASARSARVVADLLEVVDVSTLPIDTAVALNRITQSQVWPVASPRVDFTGCPASAAFTGWIVAAATAAVELALGGGGAKAAPPKSSTNGLRLDIGVNEVMALSGVTSEAKPGGLWGAARRRSTMEAGGETALPEGAQKARCQERDLLERLEARVVDEIVTVLDDDLPWLVQTEAVGEEVERRADRRRCRVSEAFAAIMDTVLRPYQVFEVVDRSLAVADSEQPDRSWAIPTFRITVSRAFGYIYVRALPLHAGTGDGRHAAMARAKDDDLLRLLSSNWMEQHDLSAMRELRTESAVWRSLIDTLVLEYQPNATRPPMKARQPDSSLANNLESSFADSLQESDWTKSAPEPRGTHGSSDRSARSFTAAVVMSFRHTRRLTLETSCLLMGFAVSVKVYEETRSDFWCEASIPSELARVGKHPAVDNTMVGLCIPKECIPLVLNDDHPMRMHTMLDAADLRELSVLIADRLKLCRIESAQRGSRSYRHWLNDAIGGREEISDSSDADKQAGEDGNLRGGPARGGGEFRLSLRKRRVGQVVFSRLVSFWVPAVEHGCVQGQGGEEGEGKSEACTLHVHRLVTVKEIAHRGACGELRVEVHNTASGGRTEPFSLMPELTNILLERKREESAGGNGGEPFSSSLYWRDALTWRLRLRLPSLVQLQDTDIDENRWFAGETHENDPTIIAVESQGHGLVSVDEREPIFSIRSVPVRRGPPANTGLESPTAKSSKPESMFDLLLLSVLSDQGNSCGHPKQENGDAAMEIVAIHRTMMDIFTFLIPVTAIIDEFSGVVDACLAIPTALSADLMLPAYGTLRDLAGTWLSFSPAEGGGYGGIATLNFPGVASMSTGPRVGLQGAGLRNLSNATRRAAMANSPLQQSRAGRVLESRPSRRDGSGDGGRGAAINNNSGELSSRSRNTPGDSIAMLPVETRNERMVLRREVMLPLLQEPNDAVPGTCLSEKKKAHINRHGKLGELETQALVISVYEAFPAEADGRVGRHLKICARDESIRPALETAISVPWVGTCEGAEGSRVWRLVTEGLRLRRTRDERTKKYVRIELKVSVPEGYSEDRSKDTAKDGSDDGSDDLAARETNVSVLDQQKTESHHTVSAPASCGEALRGNVSEQRADNCSGFNDNPQIDSTQQRNGEPQDSYPASAECETAPLLRDAGAVSRAAVTTDLVQNQRDCSDPIRQQSGGSLTTTLSMTPVDPNSTDDAAIVSSETPSAPEAKQRIVEQGDAKEHALRNRGEKVYDGWHCITGMRLHVQCFQDERYAAEHNRDGSVPFDNTEGRVDCRREPARKRIAGRGGDAFSFPRACYLQFVVCDPCGGTRSVARVSVDDVRKNLSDDGGIVETGLLEPGRRPALAKAIAQKLRLVFQADGGYSVVLPLPLGWKLAA